MILVTEGAKLTTKWTYLKRGKSGKAPYNTLSWSKYKTKENANSISQGENHWETKKKRVQNKYKIWDKKEKVAKLKILNIKKNYFKYIFGNNITLK